jgi:hypothetical protein
MDAQRCSLRFGPKVTRSGPTDARNGLANRSFQFRCQSLLLSLGTNGDGESFVHIFGRWHWWA